MGLSLASPSHNGASNEAECANTNATSTDNQGYLVDAQNG